VLKKILLVVICLFMLTSIIGCSNKDSAVNVTKDNTKKEEPVKISLVLWDEVQKPVIQKNIDNFNKAHEGKIVASVEQVPWDNYWTKLDASLQTKESADVMWMNVYLPKYADGNVVKPLDEYIAKDKLDMAQYVEGRVNAFKYSGKQYALPKGLDSVYVAYNKEIFDQYGVAYPKKGWTWDDMKKAAAELLDKISKAGKSEYPIVMELDGQPSWINFVKQNGGYYVSDDGKKTGMGLDASAGAVQNLVDLMNDKLMAPYKVLSETKGTDLFISGKGAMVFIGSWKASVLENSSIGKNGKIGLVQMPALNGSNTSVLGGLGYCLSASSKHPNEAWELIKYITSEEALYNEAVNGIDIPANKKAQAGYVKNFKNIEAQVIVDASTTGFPYPSNGNFEWTSFVDDAVQKGLSGVVPVKQALQDGAAKAQEVLDKLYKK
jgi:multiple sugar transport system substrate-binding protein